MLKMLNKKIIKKISIIFISFLFFPTKANIKEKTEKLEKSIVIVIPSYNNKDWYKKNLKSAFNQNYKNYRIIYINDASTDETGNLVEKYIKKCNQEHRTILINNKKNKGALANHYTAVHMCKDNEIIVQLDGDDCFKHKNVLQTINTIYQDPNIWLTYGQYEELHFSKTENKYFTKPGHCKQIPKNIIRAHAYREDKWVSSHLRTFYAGLFKQIKLCDLLEDGKFYTAACDIAFMMPILEMSGGKFKFIDEILYIYNCTSPINIYKTNLQKQLHTEYLIRSKEKYKPTTKPFRKKEKSQKTDLVIIAQNPQNQLYALLESINTHMQGLENIYVLHDQDKQYPKIENDFCNAYCYTYKNLKNSLESILQSSTSKYILLSKDDLIVKDFVDIKNCTKIMNQTFAHGFYLALGKNIKENKILRRPQNIPPYTEINHKIHAWQFKNGELEWRNPNNLIMTLYKKDDILNCIQNINYDSCQSLEENFNKQVFDLNQVGLFFSKSKAVSLEKIKNKINISKIFLLKNSSTLLKTDLSFENENVCI